MNRKRITGILIICLVPIALFIYLMALKDINWEEDYEDKNNKPYGTSLIKKLIINLHPKQVEEVNKELDKYFETLEKNKKFNYVFFGDELKLNPTEVKALNRFVRNGNTAFISAKNIDCLDSLIIGPTWVNPETDTNTNILNNPLLNLFIHKKSLLTKYEKDEIIHYNLLHPQLKAETDYVLYNIEKADTTLYLETNYFKTNAFNRFSSTLIFAGYVFNPEKINFLIIPWGKGQLILHSNPEFFTNIALKDSKRLDYAEKTLSHLNNGEIIYDEIHRTTYFDDSEISHAVKLDKSPLSYILSQRSLRWAWHLTIFTVLIFGLFGLKRKQYPIPIILPIKNTTLEYVKTVGQLYYMDKNHGLLAKEIRTQFFNFVKSKYQLSLTIDEEEKFTKQLQMKSELPILEIENIIRKMQYYAEDNNQLSEKLLHELYQITENFYKNCK